MRWFEASPAGRLRRATSPSSMQHASKGPTYIEPPLRGTHSNDLATHPGGLELAFYQGLLVELRRFELLTSCMPGGSTSTRVHPRRSPSLRVPASPPGIPVRCGTLCCTQRWVNYRPRKWRYLSLPTCPKTSSPAPVDVWHASSLRGSRRARPPLLPSGVGRHAYLRYEAGLLSLTVPRHVIARCCRSEAVIMYHRRAAVLSTTRRRRTGGLAVPYINTEKTDISDIYLMSREMAASDLSTGRPVPALPLGTVLACSL
jgi:hypothetical protein